MFQYKVKVTRVVDGDTVDVDIDLGFHMWLRGERVRLMGIDTPESRTSNKREKILGNKSKDRLKELVKENKGYIVLETTKEGKGKFGRILGYLHTELTDGVSFNQMLIDEGHARPYFGGSKDEQGEWAKEDGDCNCKGKKAFSRCTGNWFRWTKNGYVGFHTPMSVQDDVEVVEFNA